MSIIRNIFKTWFPPTPPPAMAPTIKKQKVETKPPRVDPVSGKFKPSVVKKLRAFAAAHAWTCIGSSHPYMVSFVRGEGDTRERMNIYTTEKNSWHYTVGTALHHPKKGRTQLFRKGCEVEDLEQFFKNPRTHTGKGYK